MSEEDNFKPVFKYYKSKRPPPELDKVLDPRSAGHQPFKFVQSTGKLNCHAHLIGKVSHQHFLFTFMPLGGQTSVLILIQTVCQLT